MTRPCRSSRLERLERPLGEPELAVVVVLDHRDPVPVGELEQRPAPGRRQRRPERELVRRRREHQPGLVGDRVDHQSVAVDGHRDHGRAVRREQLARERVAGILDSHQVARLEQHPGDQVESLLGAVGDQHVVGLGGHAAGVREVADDRPAQVGVAGGVGVGAGAVRADPHLGGDQPPPGVEREQRRVGDADPEVVRRRRALAADRQRPERPARPRVDGARRPRGRGRGGEVGDVGAGADPGVEEALRDQPLVRRRDGVAGHAEVARQRPARRQPVAHVEPAGADRLQERPVDRAGPVTPGVEVDGQIHIRTLG